MITTVAGIYHAGRIELTEPLEDIGEGTPVLVTVLRPTDIDLRAHGIDEAQAAEIRARLAAFAEEWDSPEMAIYDDYETAKVGL